MRHILIINPAAGKGGTTTALMEVAERLQQKTGQEFTCILTQRPGHATEKCRELAATGEELRFYACGGDGTANEVANGILGLPNAAMTCVPIGTGNDFLKNFGEEMAAKFSHIENLWDGDIIELDAIECNGRAALTIACSGFDARVAEDVHTYGAKLSGKSSYVASLAVNFLIRGMNQRWNMTIDGVEQEENDFTLCAVCNGRYYGGGFFPVPEARMRDGVLNAMVVKKIGRGRFLQFVGDYSAGNYHKAAAIARCVPAKEVTIEALEDGEVVTCLDGEIVRNKKVTIRLSEHKLRFFGPKGCDPDATAEEQRG